jgi:hypothetical protein
MFMTSFDRYVRDAVVSRKRSDGSSGSRYLIMLQLGIVGVMQAEREREIEAALRRRQLLKPREEGESNHPLARRTVSSNSLAVRARPSPG